LQFVEQGADLGADVKRGLAEGIGKVGAVGAHIVKLMIKYPLLMGTPN
jgi:hypothetical protein